MKKAKLIKLLIPAIVLLLAGVISLTGVTYAWFQNSDQATVSEFEANVIKADGIEMSWDAQGSTWLSTLSVTDDNFNGNKKIATAGQFRYRPVSTSGVVANGALSFFEAQVNNDKITAIAAKSYDATATEGFIKFDVYFRVTEVSIVKLTGSRIGLASYESQPHDIALAARMAIINQWNLPIEEYDPATVALKANAGISATIWEPNATVHTASGAAHGDINGNVTGVFDYLGIQKAQEGEDPLDLDRKVAGEYLAPVTTVTDLSGISINLSAGINKVTFYVWVEGQDEDCLNDLSDTALTVALNFVKETE